MKLPYFLLLALAASACSGRPDAEATKTGHLTASSPADARFDRYKNQFILSFWRLNPDYASSQGFHKYDSLLVIPDGAQRQREAAFVAQNLGTLGGFALDSLSPGNQIDWRILRNELVSERWYADTLQSWRWNPASYNLGASVGDLLNGHHYPLARRLRNISDKIAGAAAYYAAARANISQPTREHTELAVQQNEGGLAVFGPALADSIRRAGLPAAEAQLLTQRVAGAQAAIRGYLAFLQQDVLAGRTQFRSFRIGKALFDRKFALDIQSRYSADQLFALAQQHKTELLHDMGRRAARLFPKYCPGQKAPADTLALIRQVIDQLTLKHAPRDGFVAAVKRQIPVLTKYVNDHKLLTQDPTKPLVVRETPLYMRGSGAGASVSAPGPYDTKANTYYNVEPLPATWSAARAESYLREYNDYTLQILNIHEAIPGHYTQLVYANRSPSLVKSIFANGAMIEGWAVYSEKMMLESGYGGNSDEIWLLWDKWNMRSTLNAVVDNLIQTQNASETQIKQLLMREGFQEEAEATGKWHRATLSQVQLSSYFTGYAAIVALRDEVRRREDAKFSVKNFNERFLSYGNAPVKYIRDLMLGR
ncbi:DUF885 domain-containing protein [Hymenobacter sp. RP-2-7]|uniref:DUF885 domain-containing protein n=1 Tax=Hymenobacter polaris TaxID=2682546 RepID=A0A7Y0ACG6_9BACT|nr:DUF885 domain-containing protein [Hymenobacter polaris]NML64808.1 DUF885 domain-containing protein [Hymenobacter polaris]